MARRKHAVRGRGGRVAIDIAEILIRLSGESTGADDAVRGLKARLDELSGKSIRIQVDDSAAQREISGLKARLAEMSGKDVKVKVDDAEAGGKLDWLKARLAELRNKDVTVDVKTRGTGALDVLKTKWGAIGAAAVTVGPQILGALGQAGAGAGALGVAVTAAGAAFGVLGEAAKLQLTTAMTQSKKMSAQIVSDQKKVQTAQNSVTQAYATGTAKTQASANLRLALAQQQLAKDKQLQASQGNLAQQVVKGAQDMKKAFLSALGPATTQLFQGLLSAMGTIKQALPDLSGPFLTLGTAIKNALQSPAITSGIKQLIDGFGKIVTASAPLVGPIIKGFINLGLVFEHIAVAAMPALVKITKEFVAWLGKIATSTGNTDKLRGEIQRLADEFVTLVKDVMGLAKALLPLFQSAAGFQPLIGAVISLTSGFTHLLAGLGPVGRLIAGGLGLALLSQRSTIAKGAMDLLGAAGGKLFTILKALAVGGIAALLEAFPGLVAAFWAADGAISAMVPAIAAATAVAAPWLLVIGAVIAVVLLVIKFHKQLGEVVSAVWHAIENVVKAVVGAVVSVVTSGFDWIKNHIKTVMEAILIVISGPLGLVVALFVKFHKQIIAAITAAWKFIEGIFSKAWQAIEHAVSAGVSAVVGVIKKLPGLIFGALGSLVSGFLNLGKNIIQGLIHGIESMVGALTSTVVHIAKDVVEAPFKAVLGLLSPSRVFAEHGRNIGQGLINGMLSMQGPVAAAARKLANAAATAAGGNGLAAYANTSWYQSATQNDQAIIGKSESQIAQGNAAAARTIAISIQTLHPGDSATLQKISAIVSEALRRNTPTTVKR